MLFDSFKVFKYYQLRVNPTDSEKFKATKIMKCVYVLKHL